jgi:hypothetical protein
VRRHFNCDIAGKKKAVESSEAIKRWCVVEDWKRFDQ